MRVYVGDCEKCESKKVKVVSIFRSAFIPDAKANNPHELIEVCESCLSSRIFNEEHS